MVNTSRYLHEMQQLNFTFVISDVYRYASLLHTLYLPPTSANIFPQKQDACTNLQNHSGFASQPKLHLMRERS